MADVKGSDINKPYSAVAAGRPLRNKKSAENKKPYEINNPFVYTSKPPLYNNNKLQYYMYFYNDKPAYHDPDSLNWNLPSRRIQVCKRTGTVEYETGQSEVEAKDIKLKYMDFSEIFKFERVDYQIHTDKRVQKKLEELGVDIGNYIILEHYPYENGIFRFANYEHARECFRQVLKEICYEHPKTSANLMKFYLEALKRFDDKNLILNLKDIVPAEKWVDVDDGTKNGSIELVNTRSKQVASDFYKYFAKAFQRALSGQGYANRIKVFPELFSNKPFKDWKDEKNKRQFFHFCKARLAGKGGDSFRSSILSEKEQFKIFWAQIDNGELKLESSFYDALTVAARDSNILWVKNPAESRKKNKCPYYKMGACYRL